MEYFLDYRDHIYAENQVTGKTINYRKPLCMKFIDYEQTFDRVEIPVVIDVIGSQGFEEIYFKILKMYAQKASPLLNYTMTYIKYRRRESQTSEFKASSS